MKINKYLEHERRDSLLTYRLVPFFPAVQKVSRAFFVMCEFCRFGNGESMRLL